MTLNSVSGKVTLFLGVFNGEKYLPTIIKQIESQTYQDFKLLIVDNSSTDNSFQLLLDWKKRFGERMNLLKNDSNLGGGGSMNRVLSEHLIDTEWFLMIHQDDHYLPDHVEVLAKAINDSPADVIAICTSMGTLSGNGNKVSGYPRGLWLVDDFSNVSSFLINLRFQTLSWPSSAFRVKEFSQCFRYWHSPAFSDTETTLYLCGYGEFRYIAKETMLYRENPMSESHVVNSLERVVVNSIGLNRVLTSVEFKTVLKNVRKNDRAKFYSELISSIEVRIPENNLRHFLQVVATEECCRAWDYEESVSTGALADVYSAVHAEFSAQLLYRTAELDSRQPTSDLKQALSELSGVRLNAVTPLASTNYSTLRSLMSILPLKIRMHLFRIYVRIRGLKQPNYYWNAFWR